MFAPSIGVENFGDFRNSFLEDAERRGICNHQRRDIFRHQLTKFFDIDLAVRFTLDVFDLVAGDDCGCRIRAVRGVRNQNFFTRVALAL